MERDDITRLLNAATHVEVDGMPLRFFVDSKTDEISCGDSPKEEDVFYYLNYNTLINGTIIDEGYSIVSDTGLIVKFIFDHEYLPIE